MSQRLPAIKVERSQTHISSLDGIRGVAVLAVLLVHYGDLSRSSSTVLRIVGTVKDAGWIGVDIFFALSGFLITGILLESRHKSNAAVNFYMRRALRLFPLFYGVWAAVIVYIWLENLPWHAGYWLYLFYAGNFAAIKYGSVGILGISHFWSLAVEEQYYLVWPFVVWKLHGDRRAGSILLGTLLFSLAIKVVLIKNHANPFWVYFLLPTHIESIAMGSFIAIALRSEIQNRILALGRVLLPISAVALLILGSIEHGLDGRIPVIQIVGFPIIGIFACCLIVRSIDETSVTARVMTNTVLRFYGRYSYGLYVYNFLLHNLLRQYVYPSLGHVLRSPLALNCTYLLVCMLLLTLISVASFHLYESRFLQLKRYFSGTSISPQDSIPPADNRYSD